MRSPERPSKKITVLLCDDHAMVREGTRRLLEAEHDIAVVGEASDGFEAIEMVGKLSPMIVAMDVSMPKMGGIEATKRIKEQYPRTYVLALTAYDDPQYVSSLFENGASGYILKSARSDELMAAIRATALGESVLDSKIARGVFSKIGKTSVKPTQKDSVLTARETLALSLTSRGLSNKEIAAEMGVSPRTVQSHLASIFSKLNVASRTEAVMEGLKLGIISPGENQ